MAKFEEELKWQNSRIKWIIKGLSFDNLTDWEQKFLESVEQQSDKGKWLSDRQMEIVERIYRDKAD
jgi:hypothetical protein